MAVDPQKMIDRRVSKGHARGESTRLLRSLFDSHTGGNLASALVYNGFATERQAHNYAEMMRKAEDWLYYN